jgi:hypothetical protein
VNNDRARSIMPTAMRSNPFSSLLTKRWEVPQNGVLSLARVAEAHVSEIDSRWPPGRRPEDWHASWRWKEIIAGRPEAFAITAADGSVAGIWCSAKKRPIRLPSGAFYRPDYMEIAPERRGSEMGVFLFGIICARALELRADGIVLGTWPVLRRFYRGLGGIEGRVQGWNLAPNLVPFSFDSGSLEILRAALERMETHD